MLEKGYVFAYFDGSTASMYRWIDRAASGVEAGPNVFDGFSLASSSEFCSGGNMHTARGNCSASRRKRRCGPVLPTWRRVRG